MVLATSLLIRSPNRETPTPEPSDPELPDPTTGPDVIPPARVDETPDDGGRTEIQAATAADAPQGIRGRVTSPNGGPVEGAQVFLVEAASTNIFQRFAAMQAGQIYPPTAQQVTGPDGLFSLGLKAPSGSVTHEIRIQADEFADLVKGPITIQENDWFDCGNVVLEQGAVITGLVSMEGSGMGIPDARVSVEPMSNMPFTVTPGREFGLSVMTDAQGFFRIPNAPAGIVKISAVAPEFASFTNPNIQLAKGQAKEVNFQLPRGLSIAGLVIDTGGNRIANATITASSFSVKAPQQEKAYSDRDGAFEILGLHEGPYTITIKAKDFQDHTVSSPVKAGETDAKFVLEKKGSAQLQVLGNGGRVLEKYSVEVLSYFEQTGASNKLLNVPNRSISPRDLKEGVATISGLEAKDYRFMIEAPGFTKTMSDPFKVDLAMESPFLVVQMSKGGTIRGTVLSTLGEPVAGATVESRPNGSMDNPFFMGLQALAGSTTTPARVKTNSQGAFKMERMAEGEYQLKVSHPTYCEALLNDVVLTREADLEVQTIELAPGALITGIALVDGKPAGQVKITVGQPLNVTPGAAPPISLPANTQGTPTMPFTAEIVSDNQGNFTLPKRVPPGNYAIRAARQAQGAANIFGQLVDFKNTEQTFTVGPATESLEFTFSIQS